jgi:hypothetical protein
MSRYRDNMFRNVSCPAQRAYNQINHVKNQVGISGERYAEAYFEQLTEAEKQNFLVLMARIQIKGEEFVRAEVNRATLEPKNK